MSTHEQSPNDGCLTGGNAGPRLDPYADLAWKKDFDNNSWFAIGHFEREGRLLNYLFHVMILRSPDGSGIVQSVVSITDETTGWYCGDDLVTPLTDAEIGDTVALDIAIPNGRIFGTLDELWLQAQLRDGSGSIEMHLSAPSPAVFNAGTGIFQMLDMQIHQYSVPRMQSNGSITIDGVKQDVEGFSWFDRQWQMQDQAADDTLKWSWMDINLDTGDAISVWSAPLTAGGEEQAWATILHADGTQTVAFVEPGLGAGDFWTSERSGARYPTRWTVRIPAFDAVIDVIPSPPEQEIVSVEPRFNKYEGASAMTGTWKSKPVKGFGYVELVGAWR